MRPTLRLLVPSLAVLALFVGPACYRFEEAREKCLKSGRCSEGDLPHADAGTTPDGGEEPDGGALADAGVDAGVDAGCAPGELRVEGEVCAHGFCFEQPFPLGEAIIGGSGLGPVSWMVGLNGMVLRAEGCGVRQVPGPSTRTQLAVHAVDGGAWVGGLGGAWFCDAQSCAEVVVAPAGTPLNVRATSEWNGRGLIGANSGAVRLVQPDGGNLASLASFSAGLRAFAVVDEERFWALTVDNLYLSDGGTHAPVFEPPLTPATNAETIGFWRSPAGTMWIARPSSTLLRVEGGMGSPGAPVADFNPAQDLKSVIGQGEDVLWVGTGLGRVYEGPTDGGTFSQLSVANSSQPPAGAQDSLFTAWETEGAHWMAGQNGLLLRRLEGGAWSDLRGELSPGKARRLTAAHASAGEVWAVGHDHVILCRRGGAWQRCATTTDDRNNRELLAVDRAPDGTVVVGGTQGVLGEVQANGGVTLQQFELDLVTWDTTRNWGVTGFFHGPQGELYAAGWMEDQGLVLERTGKDTWSFVVSPKTQVERVVSGGGATYFLGADAQIALWPEDFQSPIPGAAVGDTLLSGWVAADGKLWFGGKGFWGSCESALTNCSSTSLDSVGQQVNVVTRWTATLPLFMYSRNSDTPVWFRVDENAVRQELNESTTLTPFGSAVDGDGGLWVVGERSLILRQK